MKRTILFVALAAGLAVGGCDDKPAGGGATSAAPSGSTTTKTADVKSADVKAADDVCAEYQKFMEACIAKQDGDAKKPYQDTLKAHKEAMKATGAQKAQMEKECRTGLATMKQDPACK